MSYFAKPNFIVYDEWFDDDFKKNKLDVKNKKIKAISNMHEFFYEQSNYKVGASENNLQIDIKVNGKEFISNNHIENTSEKYYSISNKEFRFFEKLPKSKVKFNMSKKIIYSLSIFGVALILGFLTFFITQLNKKEPNLTNESFVLEKGF